MEAPQEPEEQLAEVIPFPLDRVRTVVYLGDRAINMARLSSPELLLLRDQLDEQASHIKFERAVVMDYLHYRDTYDELTGTDHFGGDDGVA